MSKMCWSFVVVAGLLVSALVGVSAEPRVGTALTPGFEELWATAPAGEEEEFGELPDPPPPAPLEPLLVNGREVNRRFFPTLFRKTTGPLCTAALVGPSALLTAAHCMLDGVHSRFRLGDTRIRGLCRHAPGYDGGANVSEDWALCLLELPVLDIVYERVGDAVPALGTAVTLTGYGCTVPNGPSDNILRIGLANLVSRPPTSGAPVEASSIYTKTNVAAGGVVLCDGDSGGPLFQIQGNSMTDARTLVGVNSRSNGGGGVSVFAAAGSQAGRQFFESWVRLHQQKVCGVNTSDNCR